MNAIDPLLKAREVADFMQISIPTLYRRIADGTLPKPVKLGSLSRWSQSEILDAVDAARKRGAAA
ncbi:helix-turn-helix transcriptional regulator [Pseudaminobacter sp. NGMCC 1.201702]|uniref:helix-turn-helix transcriptional regulator n=1 Tax=Pseudaminobacter sp. NGMCC 1.201702 TaxID=3391825 RepID=UPI0039F0D0FF